MKFYGDGKQIRDYIYIKDVVEALRILAVEGKNNQVYNLGSGKGNSLNDILDIFKIDLKLNLSIDKVKFDSYDVQKNVLDISKICRDINWSPKIELSDGIKRTRDFYHDYYKSAAST